MIYIVLWDHNRQVRAFETRKLRNEYIAEHLLGKPVITKETVLIKEVE